MKIVIAGAGAVGLHLAKMLADEAQDIYVIDADEDKLNQINAEIDVFTILGDAKDPVILKEAKIDSCELFIAVTNIEDTNLLAAIIAKRKGAKRTIARIINHKLFSEEIKETYKRLGVDTIISPVELSAKEIIKLIKQSAFTNDYEFEDGKLVVFGISIHKESPINGKTAKESAHLNPHLDFKPLAIQRQENTFLVDKETVFSEGDIVFFSSLPHRIDTILSFCDKKKFEIKNIMIVGGGRIGTLTASLLEKDFRVKLVERDKNKSYKLADELKKTLVLNFDARDVHALENEGLEDMDAFLALSDDSETNILSSIIAKRHGVKKTIARIENIEYLNLAQNVGIDTMINKKIIAASSIFKFVRKGEVAEVANLHGADAEVIEFIVKENAKVKEKKIRDLNFPKEANIAGVVRDNKAIIPFGDFQLQEGDKAIVFSLTKSIHEIEKFF
jgi:trk system potassium uptake protein TrkA